MAGSGSNVGVELAPSATSRINAWSWNHPHHQPSALGRVLKRPHSKPLFHLRVPEHCNYLRL